MANVEHDDAAAAGRLDPRAAAEFAVGPKDHASALGHSVPHGRPVFGAALPVRTTVNLDLVAGTQSPPRRGSPGRALNDAVRTNDRLAGKRGGASAAR